MRRRSQFKSAAPIARFCSALAAAACSLVVAGCFGPFDMDPRLIGLGQHMEEVASLVAAERSAEVFEPGAPLIGGAALGTQRAAVGLRVVAGNGHRPDLSTADANPSGVSRRNLGTNDASSQTIVIDGALRVLPGFRVGTNQIRVLGVDGLARVARVSGAAPGDVAGSLSAGWGGRLGLLSSADSRRGLSLSVLSGNVPGASYEASLAPPTSATAAQASVRVSNVRATVVRLQGSFDIGAWGLTAGAGANSGSYALDRRARLTYPDSVTVVEEERGGSWNHGMWSLGVTRRVQHADIALHYGVAETLRGSGGEARPKVDAGPRHSVSLGVQFRR